MNRLVSPLVVVFAALSLGIASASFAADAPLKEDRIKFYVHDQVVGQISEAQLAGYLDILNNNHLQRSQDPVDVPTCTQLGSLTSGGSPPELFPTNGALSSAHAIIDTEQELYDVLNWGNGLGGRVALFVQDITWCGGVVPNTIGCAPTPGNTFVISLTASTSVRPMVIGHERGHNAGLPHRSDDNCAMMRASAGGSLGCLNQAEAKAFWDQANIATGDTCECIDLVAMGPNQTWSLNPQGTVCDDEDACTATSSCDDGLCAAGAAVDCDDANACTSEACDPVTGCSNPVLPDATPCDDSTVCNGMEVCVSGACTAGTPLSCDDLQFCNGPESCDAISGCQPGSPPPTDDGVACTNDSCDEVADLVVNAPDDGACANGDYCDGDEVCNPALGCEPGTPPDLDDGIACTDDSCDEVGDMPVHVPNAGLCDDGDVCTAESCDAITGCANDPIPECSPGVPAGSGAGRGVLLALLVAAGMAGLPRRS